MDDLDALRWIYIGPTLIVSGDPADVVTAELPNGTMWRGARHYIQTPPPPIGLAATLNIRAADPVVDAAGHLWARWEPDGPVQYWQDGQPLTAEEFRVRAGRC